MQVSACLRSSSTPKDKFMLTFVELGRADPPHSSNHYSTGHTTKVYTIDIFVTTVACNKKANNLPLGAPSTNRTHILSLGRTCSIH